MTGSLEFSRSEKVEEVRKSKQFANSNSTRRALPRHPPSLSPMSTEEESPVESQLTSLVESIGGDSPVQPAHEDDDDEVSSLSSRSSTSAL